MKLFIRLVARFEFELSGHVRDFKLLGQQCLHLLEDSGGLNIDGVNNVHCQAHLSRGDCSNVQIVDTFDTRNSLQRRLQMVDIDFFGMISARATTPTEPKGHSRLHP